MKKTTIKKQKTSRRSQITMLMIIGLAIFIVISLVLYLSKSAIKKQTQQSIKKTQMTSTDTRPIQEFASSCADKLAKDAISFAGKQGGYIYSSQGGTLLDYIDGQQGQMFVNFGNAKVSYGILAPSFKIGKHSAEIPIYPWPEFPYTDSTLTTKTSKGYFGTSNLPPLLKSNGPQSIQGQIESYVEKNMEECADFIIFESQGYEISMKNTKSAVTIGNNDVSVKINTTITITNLQTQEYSEINSLSTNVNVRLREAYLLAKHAIDNDISDIEFDIKDAKNEKGTIDINIVKDVFSKDDIIILTDTKSFLYGKPYQFIFARKNRAPALYYIGASSKEEEFGYAINTKEDLVNSADLPLTAKDPDEDDVEIKVEPTLPYTIESNIPRGIEIYATDGQLKDYHIISVKSTE